ncbi:hypothetical protein G4Y79_03550 [Phototrophicus methaneseepsis]|uniref:Glycosyltransferase RgtA/B/C/D-like domain-containing protein n=1 Tax=Phototrophicus methaneseepsis TaxID=2710758 RepID=A0A7S8EAQ9_9CHLR|nr:hypothetical protein [Phototrophicus methaneseepsis]QPC83469.1 hypothetical protein G4Y79_03550 [Phototrophicus methaneseepsis]
MRTQLRKHIPLIIMLILLTGIFAVLVTQIQSQLDGHFIYGVDDAYIHMAVAKNLAENGVWGTQATEFSSSTSSLLYPFAIAVIYKVTGSANEWAPLLLNIIAGYAVVVAVYWILRREGAGDRVLFLFLLLLILAIPIPGLAFMGMEHLFHILFFILFIYHVACMISADKDQLNTSDYVWLIVLAMLQTLIRYEGVFTLACVALLFLLRLRILPAIGVLGMGIMPLALFGIYSVSQGSLPIPNSIYLKGSVETYHSVLDYLQAIRPDMVLLKAYQMTTLWLMLIVLGLGVALVVIRWRKNRVARDKAVDRDFLLQQLWRMENVLILLFIGNTILHNQFMSNNFLRYEAYLIGSFIFICALLLSKILNESIRTIQRVTVAFFAASMLVLCLLPSFINLALRSTTVGLIPTWTREIYEQQYQFTMFAREELPAGAPIAINDIGAMSYYTDIPYVDLFGLANIDIARAGGAYHMKPAVGQEIVKNSKAQFAIIYDIWAKPFIPSDWVLVATWKIPTPLIVFQDTVSFYAADAEKAGLMRQGLQHYEAKLPSEVSVAYVDQ